MAARLITITIGKGGVGKSTTTINLGAELARAGHRVLIVDFDKQGDSTKGLGLQRLDGPVAHALVERGSELASLIQNTYLPGLDLIPADSYLASAPLKTATLQTALRPLALSEQYNFILIDTPPSLNTQSECAIVAAAALGGYVLTPIYFDFFVLSGLSDLLDSTDEYAEQYGRNPDTFVNILFNKVDLRKKANQRYAESQLKDYEGGILRSFIREDNTASLAAAAGRAVADFSPSSKAAADFREVALEIISMENVNDESEEKDNSSGERAGEPKKAVNH